MHVGERQRDLAADRRRLVGGERLSATVALGHPLGQRATVGPRHHEVRRAVVGLAELVAARDPRALGVEQDARLGQEATVDVRVAAPVVGQDLDRDAALQRVVVGQPDRGERTRAQDPVEPVTSHRLRGHGPNLRPDVVGHRSVAAGDRGVIVVDLEQLERTARLAADGDARALDRLLTDARPLVLGRCRRFLPNELDAEEATQDALFAVARHITRFEGRCKFTTWLYQLTTTAAIGCYRKLKRRRSVLELPPEQPASGSSPSVVTGARIDLLEAAERIDRRVAETVFLRDLCDLEYADIAALLDVPLGTVKSRIASGRAELRNALYG